MSCPSVRCPEDAALFDGADYLCRIKDQSSTTSYDQTFHPQWSAHQMGHVVVTIRYTFSVQKATKGQAIADLLTENPRSKSATLFEELPDETAEVHSSQVNPTIWQMYFDGASRTIPRAGLVAGVGVVFISPQNHVIPRAFSLTDLAPTMLQ